MTQAADSASGHDAGAPGGPGQPAALPDLVGTVLAGRYRILRRLGEGAMGSVYVGEHLHIGRHDAIKVLRGALATDSSSIARFNRGARNLSAIRHPNVCALYDYGETADGSPFLALELIEGESLKELLDREQKLEPMRAIRMARQVAAALDAAHDAGIVHRDLKPANIMVMRGRDGSDIAKVVDFDIAKGPEGMTGDEVTRLGFVIGTPEYMSPEQLMGERLDGRSDVYSLGIVLFRMLAGVLPFRGSGPQDLMVQRLTNLPLTLEQATGESTVPGLQLVLDRALVRERDARYSTAEEMARDLDGFLKQEAPAPSARSSISYAQRGEPGSVPETMISAPATVGSPGRSRVKPWWIAGAAVLVLGGGILVAMPILGRDGDERAPLPAPGATVDPGIRSEPQVTSQPVTGDDAAGARGAAGPTGAEPVRRAEPPPPRDDPPAGVPARIQVRAADANDTLFRLLDRLSEPGAAAAAGSVRDTASAIWETAGVARDDRALAAYVAANAFLALRNGAECERWINRALEIRPDGPGYASLLTSCRSAGS